MEILQKQDILVVAYMFLIVCTLSIIAISFIIYRAKKDKDISQEDKKGTIYLGLGSIVFILVITVGAILFIPERYDAIVTDVSDVYDQGYEVIDVDKDTGIYTIQRRD